MDSIGIFAMYLFLAGGTLVMSIWLRGKLAQARLAAEHRTEDSMHQKYPLSSQRGVLLEQVYPKDKMDKDRTNTEIDIIAIHGLDTESPTTWTWKDPKNPSEHNVNWLSDTGMLPDKVGQARIFTCDWPADLFERSNLTQKTIEEFARLLLAGIKRRPLGRNNHARREDRPILFIASCLGGIVLMKALVMADHEYLSVRQSTHGVVFLATPFRGTSFQDVADWAERGLKARASIQGQVVTKLLDSVKGPTFDIEELVRSFTHLCQKQPYQIFTFYEKGKTDLYRKVFPWLPFPLRPAKPLVDKSSASLDIVPHPLPLDRSHVMMNKFCGPKDPDYLNVIGKIEECLKTIRKGTVLERADACIRDDHYTAERLKIERLSGETLDMAQCYINLTIIEQHGRDADRSEKGSEGDRALQSSPFSLSARLKVETPDKETQVKLRSIFEPRKGPDGHKKEPRRMLIQGRAGVGKTTLCKKIIFDFTHYDVWKELFDRLLWIPLRRLKGKTAESYGFEDLFFDMYFHRQGKDDGWRLAKELCQTLKNTSGAKTLFILDGLDEVSELLDPEHIMFSVLQDLLNQPNVIITSRPFSTRLDHLDLELETIGFYPDQVEHYLKKTLCDSRKVDEVQSFLQKNWLIKGLVRIPIQLDALCYVWDDELSSRAMTQTMTALYQAIEQRLWKKDAVKLEKSRQTKKVTNIIVRGYSPRELEDLVHHELDLLEWLSFTGLHSNVINFDWKQHLGTISSHFKLETCLSLAETLAQLSFIRTPDPSSDDGNQSYHFLHLTFQEYFAARYFVGKWTSRGQLGCLELRSSDIKHSKPVSTDPISYLQTYKYNERYNVFWRFVAGLLSAEGGEETLRFFQTIEDEPRDLLGPVHQRLVMHCLSEVPRSQKTQQFSQLRKHLEGQLKDWLLFECNFEFSYTRHSQLAAEMEFPEQILKDILQKGSEDTKWKIINSLQARQTLSPDIIKLIASYLGDGFSKRLKIAAVTIFQRHYTDLPNEILEALVLLLKDPDKRVSWAAAEALSRQSTLPDEILEALVLLLKDPDKRVRWAAAKVSNSQSTLSNEILEALVPLLKDPDEEVSWAAAEALSRQSTLPDEILEALVLLLKDPDERVRWAAAEVLGSQSALSDEILEALVPLLKDPDEEVSWAAAEALSRQSTMSNEILKALVPLLKDPNRRVRLVAAEVLSSQSALSDEILEALVPLLKDPNKSVRSAAAKALSSKSTLSDEILEALVPLLKDPDEEVRLAAAEALSSQSTLLDEILEALVPLLKDPDEGVRLAAAEALSRQSTLPDEILEALVLLLKDPDMWVRSAAARALSSKSTMSNEIPKALVPLLKDPNRRVRLVAATALCSQSTMSNEILKALVLLLKDPDRRVRSVAATAFISQSTPLSNEILEALEPMLKDPDSWVRSAAAMTLSRQSTLPDEILEAVLALLQDPGTRLAASQVLGKLATLPDERFHHFLLKLDSQSFNDVYGDWLRRSFSDHLTWYVKGNNYIINMPEGSRNVTFNQLQSAVQKAQGSWEVPTP